MDFLIKAFDHIRHKIDLSIRSEIADIKRNKKSFSEEQKAINKCLEECDPNIEGSRYYKLCNDYIYGVDANPRMARTSKMNMIMHGDGHVGVYLHDGLLNVGGVFDNRFDVIITNPPFGARVEKITRVTSGDIPDNDESDRNVNKYGVEYTDKVYNAIKKWAEIKNNDGTTGRPILDLFDINSNLTEVLFIERCLNLLKPGGRLAIVLPEGVLTNDKQEKIRIFRECKLKCVSVNIRCDFYETVYRLIS